MKPIYKLLLIICSIISLNFYFGTDWRFTIINIVWCIPIAFELVKPQNPIGRKGNDFRAEGGYPLDHNK